jgi:glycosyltransferase involved in cell wall biosynthesis
MQISYGTHAGGLEVTQGYGYAGYNIIKSLQELGHTTPFNHPDAPVQFDFTQPYYYQWHPGHNQYHIGYTPWESTQLMDGWVDAMNACDEVWTTSDWCMDVFEKAGVTKPLFLFPHGIEHIWKPFRRLYSGQKLRFLHVGEPAHRKCGQMAFDAFVELFGNDNRYHLTIKSNGYSTIRAKLPSGEIADPEERYHNVTIIREVLDINDLISLYNKSHVLLYPSYGEGFGFIPLQAMASGMPTIMNTTWAPYRDYSVGLNVTDREVDTLWPEVHPGKVLEPNFESLKEQMARAADDFETYADAAFEVAPSIHLAYDWKNVTEAAFEHVVKRFS